VPAHAGGRRDLLAAAWAAGHPGSLT
jgi:hypothetical protein